MTDDFVHVGDSGGVGRRLQYYSCHG